MYVLIAGGGKVGFYLAQELLNSNHEVLIVEREGGRVASIIEELGDNVLHGDGCEATTLDAAGVARADLVAAVTGDDEDNLVICEIARRRGVTRTIARINNPKNELLFKKRGIETTISATTAVLAQIEQELPTGEMIPLLQMHSGLELVEIKLPETSPVAGRSIREVLLPPESLISLVVDPGGVPRIPSGDTRLQAGDALVVVTRRESAAVLREALIGSTHGLDT
ncbi:MAG: TrkA family potassium uptake protein [Chloroflexi bacterium]|jgi:trk system potassium uptake protein TrkA|nr:TrkA family potassium uptake protein [Chloroflexota bacterium]